MQVAPSGSPDDTEDEEDEFAPREDRLQEDDLDDFNDFLADDRSKHDFDTNKQTESDGNQLSNSSLVPIHMPLQMELRKNAAPPKPPRTERLTVTNLSTHTAASPTTRPARSTFISSRSPPAGNNPTDTVPGGKPVMMARKSLLDSISLSGISSVLRPTGLLGNLAPKQPAAAAAAVPPPPIDPVSPVVSSPKMVTIESQSNHNTQQVPPPEENAASPQPTGSRRPRRTNICLKPDPVLNELAAKLDGQRLKTEDS